MSLAALWLSATSSAWIVSAAAWCIRTKFACTDLTFSCEIFAACGWSDSEVFSDSIIRPLTNREHSHGVGTKPSRTVRDGEDNGSDFTTKLLSLQAPCACSYNPPISFEENRCVVIYFSLS